MHPQVKVQPSSAEPTRVVYGPSISRDARIRLGCSVVLLNSSRTSVLLTRRSDNGLWCLPGGMVDPGENVTQACEREVYEETGLKVSILRLTGLYSNPNCIVIYPDGNRAYVVVMTFEVLLLGGALGLSPETSEARYFPVSEAVKMDLFHDHAVMLQDALAGREEPFIR
jgi:ADP-ribose pyrophosphatase YjhB (NUDIX family)